VLVSLTNAFLLVHSTAATLCVESQEGDSVNVGCLICLVNGVKPFSCFSERNLFENDLFFSFDRHNLRFVSFQCRVFMVALLLFFPFYCFTASISHRF